jgi:hypothetical protein
MRIRRKAHIALGNIDLPDACRPQEHRSYFSQSEIEAPFPRSAHKTPGKATRSANQSLSAAIAIQPKCAGES